MNIYEIRGQGIANMLASKKKDLENKILSNNISIIENSELLDIKGVGQSTVKILMENGIRTQNDLNSSIDLNKMKLNPIAKKAIENFLKQK